MSKHLTIPPAIANLGLSIDIPDGFVRAELPPSEVDFDNPTQSAPLAIFSSQVALALITVAARPAYETGSVLQWLKYLCDSYGIDIKSFKASATKGEHKHPAIFAECEQEQNGEQLRLAIVAIEDAGRLVTVHGMCPAELWPSYGDQLTAAVQSISLTAPQGQKYDLDSTTAEGWTKITPAQQSKAYEKHMKELKERREPAEHSAAALIAEDKFEEAEAHVMKADSSIYGAVALAKLYESRLKAMVHDGATRKQKDRVERLFHRALSWAQNCYPEAHTEVEAEDYAAGRTEDRARLVAILGYEPK